MAFSLSFFVITSVFTCPYQINIWKPDPGIYKHAAHNMGFPVGQCIVIDDGLVGVEAGYKAGMKAFFYNQFNETCDSPSVVSFSLNEGTVGASWNLKKKLKTIGDLS